MKKFRIFTFILAIVCICSTALGLISCKKDDSQGGQTPPPVEKPFDFELYKYNLSLTIGATYKLGVKGEINDQIVFSSEDPTVASIDANGLIIAEGIGTTKILVIINEVVKECKVKVSDSSECPHIDVYNVSESENLRLFVNGEYSIDSAVIYMGKDVGAQVSLSSSDAQTVSVNGNVLKGLKTGVAEITATATYKTWTAETKFTVEVVRNVAVYLDATSLEMSYSNAVGQIKEYTFAQPVVTVDGQNVTNNQVEWESLDNEIATVTNGKVTAISVGTTEVRAVYTLEDVKYWAYATVEVVDPYLKKIESATYDDEVKIIKWSTVDYADKYQVEIDGKTIETDKTEFSTKDYFGSYTVKITAFSDKEDVVDSPIYQLPINITSFNIEDRALVADQYECVITEETEFNELFEEKIYLVKKGSATPFNNAETFGYMFRKIYFTPSAAGFSSIKAWLNSALIDKEESTARYASGAITFWAYAIEKVTFRISYTDMNGDNAVLASQEIPAHQWTKVTLQLTDSKCFRFITFMTSSADFYFKDLCISTIDYSGKDYSNCAFFKGWKMQSYIDAIAQVSTEEDLSSYKDTILIGRETYGYLSDNDKSRLVNYDKFCEVEQAFYSQKAQEIESAINNAGDMQRVKDARKKYESALDAVKKAVDNYETLKQKEINVLITGLEGITPLTVEHESELKELRKFYDGLVDEVKNSSTMTNAYERLVEYEENMLSLKVGEVKNLIADLPESTKVESADAEKVYLAREKYSALPEEYKSQISKSELDKLLACEKTLNFCLAQIAIDNLPEVKTLSREDAMVLYNVLIAYNQLNDEQKAMISNVKKLTDSITAFEGLYQTVATYGTEFSSQLITPHSSDSFWAIETISDVFSTEKALNYNSTYFYAGEFGNLVKINVKVNTPHPANETGGLQNSWAVAYDFASLKAKMEDVGAESATVRIYLNKNGTSQVYIGTYDKSKGGLLFDLKSGWNEITITKAQIDLIVSNNCNMICKDHIGAVELWISDFFLNLPDARYKIVEVQIEKLKKTLDVNALKEQDYVLIYGAFANYNALTNEDKQNVSNYADLTALDSAFKQNYDVQILYGATEQEGNVRGDGSEKRLDLSYANDLLYGPTLKGTYTYLINQNNSTIHFAGDITTRRLGYNICFGIKASQDLTLKHWTGSTYSEITSLIANEWKHVSVPYSSVIIAQQQFTTGIRDAWTLNAQGLKSGQSIEVSAIFAIKDKKAYADVKQVFGNDLSTAFTTWEGVEGADTFSAIETISTVTDQTYGNVVKIDITEGNHANTDVNRHWWVNVNYAKVLEMMELTGKDTVKFYIRYETSVTGRNADWIRLDGTTSDSSGNWIEIRNNGEWQEFTLTKQQIENFSKSAWTYTYAGGIPLTFYVTDFYFVD
ncbi:MAG: Ig-like domain-containing protein [Clostridia bacterium]|nr:Ig-like domain-containing protein [Clostridia bacterium]